MDTLVYNAAHLTYEVPVKPLSDLDKEKVCLIQDMNKIQTAFNKGPITPQQFNELWDTPIDALRSYVWDQQATLNRLKYEEAKQIIK